MRIFLVYKLLNIYLEYKHKSKDSTNEISKTQNDDHKSDPIVRSEPSLSIINTRVVIVQNRRHSSAVRRALSGSVRQITEHIEVARSLREQATRSATHRILMVIMVVMVIVMIAIDAAVVDCSPAAHGCGRVELARLLLLEIGWKSECVGRGRVFRYECHVEIALGATQRAQEEDPQCERD